jgi:hypothetical protein
MASKNLQLSRRNLVAAGCASLAGLASGTTRAQSLGQREALDVGGVANGSLHFDPIAGSTEPSQKPKPGALAALRARRLAIAGTGG